MPRMLRYLILPALSLLPKHLNPREKEEINTYEWKQRGEDINWIPRKRKKAPRGKNILQILAISVS